MLVLQLEITLEGAERPSTGCAIALSLYRVRLQGNRITRCVIITARGVRFVKVLVILTVMSYKFAKLLQIVQGTMYASEETWSGELHKL